MDKEIRALIGLKHESPFVADMVFCPKHDDQSNVIDVNQCQQCYAPGSQKDHRVNTRGANTELGQL